MRKGDIRKQAILDVSERLFYQKGYEQTSVQDVLSILKCSKGSFYHHFESKMAVLETLCINRVNKSLMAYEKALRSDMTALERLNMLLYYANPLRKSELQFLTLLLPMAVTPEGAVLSTHYQEAITNTFASVLGNLLEQGYLEGVYFIPRLDGVSKIILMLINHFWREAARKVAACKTSSGVIDAAALMPLTELYRYAIERMIEAPYGSVELIHLTELVPLFNHVMIHMRLEP